MKTKHNMANEWMKETQWQFFGIIHFLFLNLYYIFYNIRKKVWFSPKFFAVIDFFPFLILLLHSEISYCTPRSIIALYGKIWDLYTLNWPIRLQIFFALAIRRNTINALVPISTIMKLEFDLIHFCTTARDLTKRSQNTCYKLQCK